MTGRDDATKTLAPAPTDASPIPAHVRESAGWRWLVERLTQPLSDEQPTPATGARHAERPDAA